MYVKSKKAEFTETKSRMMAARGRACEWGNEEMVVKGVQTSSHNMNYILRI